MTEPSADLVDDAIIDIGPRPTVEATAVEPAELEPARPDIGAGNATTVALAAGGNTVPGTDLPIVPGDNELANLAQMAVTLAAADIVPRALRGKANDVLLVLLTARDLGVALTTAIREFHVIEGKVTLSPKVKLAMVRNAGGNIFPHQAPREVLVRGKAKRLVCPCGSEAGANDVTGATWHAERADSPGILYSSTYTLEEAPAELKRKDNWKNYPARMVSWRALGYLLDDVYPEVGTGLYSPDELGAVTDEQGEPVIDVVGSATPLPGTKAPASHRRNEPEEAADPAVIAELEAGYADLELPAQTVFRERWVAAGLPKVANLAARQVGKARAVLDYAGTHGTTKAPEEPQDGPQEPAEPSPAPEDPPAESAADIAARLKTELALETVAAEELREELGDAITGETADVTVVDEVAPFTEADADKVLEAAGLTGATSRASIVEDVTRLRAGAVRDEVLELGLKMPSKPTDARALLIAARCVDAGLGTELELAAVTEALK